MIPPATADVSHGIGMRMDCGACPAPPWHVAYTEHRQETVALAELWRRGFRAHLPLYVSRTRGNAPRVLPLFPRYVMVAFDPRRDPWGLVGRTRGVERLLLTGSGLPAALPHGFVESLMDAGRAGDGAIDPRVEMPRFVGRMVEITGGPFAGVRALCDAEDAARVHLLLAVFGRDAPAWLARDQVDIVA